jgi:hypothetical protein
MSSVVLFTVNVSQMATFYEAILEATPLVEPSGDVRLFGERDEVLIHSIPKKIARTITVSTPPTARDGSPIKPVFDVGELASKLDLVPVHGGVVTDFHFIMDGRTRHDVLDPDGNIIQLRDRIP